MNNESKQHELADEAWFALNSLQKKYFPEEYDPYIFQKTLLVLFLNSIIFSATHSKRNDKRQLLLELSEEWIDSLKKSLTRYLDSIHSEEPSAG